MASVKDKSSQLIGRILNTVYNECPWWLVPVKLPKWTFDNGSVLSIQSGMQSYWIGTRMDAALSSPFGIGRYSRSTKDN